MYAGKGNVVIYSFEVGVVDAGIEMAALSVSARILLRLMVITTGTTRLSGGYSGEDLLKSRPDGWKAGVHHSKIGLQYTIDRDRRVVKGDVR